MLITKIFTAENSHIVRNAFSTFCSQNTHGHSYKIELTLRGNSLDNAGMLVDFGVLKGPIKDMIESMDHSHTLWSGDEGDYKNFIKKFNQRWIETPFNPTAEMLSIFIFKYAQYIIDHTTFTNGEGDVKVYSVKVHETATGSATCFEDDVRNIWKDEWFDQLIFSNGIKDHWGSELHNIMQGRTYVVPEVVNCRV